MRPFVLSLLLAAPALACSCVNVPTACSAATGDQVVFVARVLADSGEGLGKGPARVLVEERLFNTPEEWKEVEVGTAHRTSCYYRLETGKRYVLFPWKDGSRLSVAGCSPNFELAGNEHILDALRNQARGGLPRIVGKVLTAGATGAEWIGGARVIAKSPSTMFETVTDSGGRFELRELLPGRYKLEVTKVGYAPDREFNRQWDRVQRDPEQDGVVAVASGSCQVWNLAMWPEGSISGSVVDRQGVPLAGVTVQAFEFDARGERESRPIRTAQTDQHGRYTIRPLPAGAYVVGVNAELHNDGNAYPPTIYHALNEEGATTRVRVERSGEVRSINLSLPPKRTPAIIRVQVLSPKGIPSADAHVRLEDLSGRQRAASREKTGKDGVAGIPAYIGGRYVVRALNYPLEGTSRIDVRSASESVTVVLAEQPRGQ